MPRYKDTDIKLHVAQYLEYRKTVSMKLEDFIKAFGFSRLYARKLKKLSKRLTDGLEQQPYLLWNDTQGFAMLGISKGKMGALRDILKRYGMVMEGHAIASSTNCEQRVKLNLKEQLIYLGAPTSIQREWANDLHVLLHSVPYHRHVVREGGKERYEQWREENFSPEEILKFNERMVSTVYSDELKQNILQDLKKYSAHFVAKKYEGMVSHNTIRRWAKEADIELLTLKTGAKVPEGMSAYGVGAKRKKSTWIEERNADIYAALGELSVVEVADKFKLTTAYIYKLMQDDKKNIKHINAERLRDRQAKAVELFDIYPWSEICAKFGISRSTLYKWVREAGLPVKGVSEERRMELVQLARKHRSTITDFAKQQEISMELARRSIGLAEMMKSRDYFTMEDRDDCLILQLPWTKVKMFNKELRKRQLTVEVYKDTCVFRCKGNEHKVPLDKIRSIMYAEPKVIELACEKLAKGLEEK
jgi:transposase-like protein